LPAESVRLERDNISIPGKAVTSPRVSGGSGIAAPHRWRTSSPLAPTSPCDQPSSGPSGEGAAAALLRGPVGGRGTGVLLCLGMTRKLTCIPSYPLGLWRRFPCATTPWNQQPPATLLLSYDPDDTSFFVVGLPASRRGATAHGRLFSANCLGSPLSVYPLGTKAFSRFLLGRPVFEPVRV
jgi:hypothetical protein